MQEGRSREDRDLLTQPGPGPSPSEVCSGDQGHHAKPGTVPRDGELGGTQGQSGEAQGLSRAEHARFSS